MKYTLLLFFGFLCIIELNALNLRPKSPVKISSQSTSNVHTKTGTSKIEIKGHKESHKPNIPIKTTTSTKISTKTSTNTSTRTTTKRTSGSITIHPDRKKDIDKFKEKLKDRIKHNMTDQEIKKIVDDVRKKMKHQVTDQEIKKIIDDLKKQKSHPIKTDPIMKKILSQLKRKKPITDPAIKNLLEELKRKHKLTDAEMKNLVKQLQKRTQNPIVKPAGPTKTTLPKNQNQESTKKLIDFLKSKLGCGYAYGSEGQNLSSDLLNRLKSQYPNYVKDSTKQWIGKECYDCSGLTMKALQQIGINVHHNAQYTWAEDLKQKGDINSMPTDKLCLVFKRGDNGEMHHIGVYIGNGKVIEAKGADYGVVETDLKGGNWTNWGIPAGLE